MSPRDQPDDRVIVLGGEGETPPGATPNRPSRWAVLVFATVTAMFLGLIGFLLDPRAEDPTPVSPGDLPAPEEPVAAPPPGRAPVAVFEAEPIPPAAHGWKPVELIGTAWGITSIDHGPDGWLAVAEGGSGLVVHTSPDAVTWSGRSLPVVRGYAVRAAVGDRLMVVASSGCPETDGGPAAAVSVDGGTTWTLTPLVANGGCVLITALEEVGGAVYAAGAVGDNAFGAGPTRAGLWRYDGSSWVALDAGTGPGSLFNAVVRGSDGKVWALGHSERGPAVWMVEGDRAVEVPVTLPERVAGRVFLDVADTGSRYLALVGARGPNTSGRHIVASADLVDWELVADTGSDLVSIEAPGDGSLLGRQAEGGELWAMSGRSGVVLPGFYGSPLGERLSLPYIGAMAAGGGVVVLGGTTESAVTLLVRGVVGTPTTEAAVAVEGRWERVAVIDVLGAAAVGWPFLVVSEGEDTFVAVPGHVLAVNRLTSGEVSLRSVLSDPSWAGVGPDGIWATAVQPRNTWLHSYAGDGVWTSEEIPLASLEAVGRVDGRTIALGWDTDGSVALRREDSGEWVTHADDLPVLYAAVAVANGFLATSEQSGAVASADGVQWTRLEGSLISGWGGMLPYLVDDRPGVITLADRWPLLEEVELPLVHPTWAVRSGEDLWVGDGQRMVIGSPSGGWSEIPLGLEHGIAGTVLPIPGGEPMLAMIAGDEVSVLRWVERSGS